MDHTKQWYKLDNVAKIFPSSARGGDTRVFRLTCELKEEIDPGLLQEALDQVIPGYPHMLCVLRKGFFWYYLDPRDLKPAVSEENIPACSPLYREGCKNLLFRVNYFHRRINLEVFHVLADGTGAFMFFRALVLRYLSLKHDLQLPAGSFDDATADDRSSDAFSRFYQPQKQLKQLNEMSSKKAYHLKGTPDENLMPHLVEGTVSVSRFARTAREYGTTFGVLITSLYMAAIMEEMSVHDRLKPVVISVPVNLRKYFPTSTARNFFGVINISYDPGHDTGELKDLIAEVAAAFREQLVPEQILRTMNSYATLEHNPAIQMVPLLFKDLTIRYNNRRAEQGVTTTMSNLGSVEMPAEVIPYIDRFGAFMTAPSEQLCVVSFQDRMVFGDCSSFTTHKVMFHFFRRLTELGIPVELASNDYEVI